MTKSFTIAFFLILTGLLGCSQEFDKNKLNTYFEAIEKSGKFMGSVAIAEKGKVIYAKSIGYRDVDAEKRADEHTKYRIGSISKTFTATLVLKAVEENRLSLSQSIEPFFPSIVNASNITIGNLLNHRSGIHNFTSNTDYSAWCTQPKTENEMIAIIADSGSDFEPNAKASYSNSNYVLLTYILERTFNEPYAALLDRYIAKPLGLSDTYVGGKINTETNEAHSYKSVDGWVKESETDPSIPQGAGAIVSTPSDIIKFGEALFAGKIIAGEHVARMKTIDEGYGMGLFQMPFNEKRAFGHSGGIDGFSSTWGYFPDEHVSFAITGNGSALNTNDMAIAVLSALFNQPYDIPKFSNYAVKEETLHQYIGVYSSTQLPIKITVTNAGNTLIAQATGQPSFPLEATEMNIFRFDRAGVVMEFNPTEDRLILKQRGGEFLFTKDK